MCVCVYTQSIACHYTLKHFFMRNIRIDPWKQIPVSLMYSFCMYSISSCSLEVVLRAEAVEMVQAGDKCDFTGTLIVVPDVSQLRMEGQ